MPWFAVNIWLCCLLKIIAKSVFREFLHKAQKSLDIKILWV